MFKILTISIFFILNSGINAQNNLPLNINDVYQAPQKEFKRILRTRTYSGSDYLSETVHYFDEQGRNFLTESYYEGNKQSKTVLKYDSSNHLVNYKTYNCWIDMPDGNAVWDSTKISWENNYEYNLKE